MAKYRVTQTRQVVFSRTVEVDADDEEEAIEMADDGNDADGVVDNDQWEPGSVESYGAPDVEKIGE